MIKLTDLLLREYSDKVINATIERWKQENPKADDNTSKQLIQRFDQIKNSLSQKIDIVALSDELKKNNNYLDINKYSFDDMVKLLRSLPENPEKIKKEAVSKFIDKEGIDKTTSQSYVARFMTKKDNLKHAAAEGIENQFTKEEVLEFIPRFLQQNNMYLDPRNWKWQPFEQMLDALFPSQRKATEGDTNSASTEADKIYDKDGIEIYKGDDVHKCISYNPTNASGRKKYGWCVTQVGNTNYDYYRFGDKAPTFYFVFDRNKPDTDKWHAFVVQVTADNKQYIVTDANNRGDIDTKDNGWEGVSKIVSPDTWNHIKNLKDYFKPIALSPVERGRKFASGKNLSVDEFKELTQDEKILYVQGKASKNQISSDILKLLPQYKIQLEGRTTTLANVAIDSGQKFTYDDLKDYESLAKRYAIFRFRHTNYSKDPIPLPFIKYLDDEAKIEYYKKFKDEYLTYELIRDYFSPAVLELYINEELDKLGFLPDDAKKYMNQEQRQKFDLYSLGWKDHKYSAGEVDLSKVNEAPEQNLEIVPISHETFSSMDANDKKNLLSLINSLNKDKSNYEKYPFIMYGIPTTLLIDGKYYFITRKNKNDDEKGVLMNSNGNILKDNINLYSLNITKDGKEVRDGSIYSILAPSTSNNLYFTDKDFDSIDLGNKNTMSIDELKSILSESQYLVYNFKRRAGIIK